MINLLNEPHKLFAPEQAEKAVAELQKDDPDWVYVVRHDPTGKGLSFIEIYDEDGEFVSRF